METVPLTEAKARLSELVEKVAREQLRVLVTRNGRATAVLMSVEDLEGLEDTLEILSDPRALRSLRRSIREADEGRAIPLEETFPPDRGATR